MPPTDAGARPPRPRSPVAEELEYAHLALRHALATARRPVAEPRLRITPHARAGAAPVVVVQVNAAVAGQLVRAQVAASTARDAVDRAVDSFHRHLDRLCRHLTATEAGATTFTADEWNTAPVPAPAGLTGSGTHPAEVVRWKNCSPAVQGTDAAAFTMDLRGYRFHLFLDRTGHPALVYRGGPSGYRLIRSVAPETPVEGTAPLTVQPQPALPSSLMQAVAVLNAVPARQFVFFLEPERVLGRVVYRRYDGRLGLLAASAPGDDGTDTRPRPRDV